MTAEEIVQAVQERFGSRVLAAYPADKHPRIEINVEDWRQVAEFLHSDPRIQLDWLANLTGVDYVAAGKLAVVYDLYSFELKHTFAVKVFCVRDDAKFPTMVDLWPAANWHEREAFDLLGIVFEGHPNLTRILCAEEWVGFPLRKDYVFPKTYHDIPGDPGMPWDPTTKKAVKPAAPAATPAAKPAQG